MRCNKFEGKRGIEDDIIPREDTATPNQQTWLRSTTPPGDFHPQPLPLSISQPNSNRITFPPFPLSLFIPLPRLPLPLNYHPPCYILEYLADAFTRLSRGEK